MDREEDYLDFELVGMREKDSRDGISYWVHVYPKNETEVEHLFSENTFITGTALKMKFGSRLYDKAWDHVTEITFSKARARLALELYDEGNEYEQVISSENLEDDLRKSPEDKYIKKMILTALYNLRRNHPTDFDSQTIDVNGFCNILGIEEKDYLFISGLLIEDDLVAKNPTFDFSVEEGGIHITSFGVNQLRNLKEKDRTDKDMSTESEEEDEEKAVDEYDYDIALSFAGEDREIAEKLAEKLKSKGINVFYDKFEEAELWGKNLYDYLSEIYGSRARFTVMLVSKSYAEKSWTNLERKSAQAKAFRENREYILPIRLDDTNLPGLAETVGYIKYTDENFEKIIDLVIQKLRQTL